MAAAATSIGTYLEVPVINAAGLLTGLSWPHDDTVKQISAACEQWGFFQITNHGLPADFLQCHFAACRRFFDLPLEQKVTCRRTRDNAMGFFNDELTKQRLDLKEGYDFSRKIRRDLPDDHYLNRQVDGNAQWPAGARQEFKSAMLKYYIIMERFGLRLTEALCAGLGLPTHALHPMLEKGHQSFCRLNYYPCSSSAPAADVHSNPDAAPASDSPSEAIAGDGPSDAGKDTASANGNAPRSAAQDDSTPTFHQQQQQQEGGAARGKRAQVESSQGQAWHEEGRDLGISPHSDSGFLTVLAQGSVAGLEVWHAGKWHLVKPIPGAFVVNVGDMCQVLTNGRYKAPLHRVLASGPEPRYSAAFFFSPAHEAEVAPLPSCIDEAHPALYRPIKWGYFRARRYAGDQEDLGKEIQLDDYLIT